MDIAVTVGEELRGTLPVFLSITTGEGQEGPCSIPATALRLASFSSQQLLVPTVTDMPMETSERRLRCH